MLCLSVNSKELRFGKGIFSLLLFSFNLTLVYKGLQKQKVVFYVSMFLSADDQNIFSQFVKSSVNQLQVIHLIIQKNLRNNNSFRFKKKKFKSTTFIVLDFNSLSHKENHNSLENAQIVVYMLKSTQELSYFRKEFLIGTNSYHCDLYKIIHHPRLVVCEFTNRSQHLNLQYLYLQLPKQTNSLLNILMANESGTPNSLLFKIQNLFGGYCFKRLKEINMRRLRKSLKQIYDNAMRSNNDFANFQVSGFDSQPNRQDGFFTFE